MTDRSTDLQKLVQAVHDWAGSQDHYYQKRSAIIDKIEHDGRTFYHRYEKVDKHLPKELIEQHLSRKVNIAIPITSQDHGKYLFFIYKGEAPERFVYLIEHLLQMKHQNKYMTFEGKHPDTRIVSIELTIQNISSIHSYGKEISSLLEKNMTKSWKILPDPSLPESYNIITLPYIN